MRTASGERPSAPASPARPAVAAAGPLRWSWPTDGQVESTFSASDPARKGIKVAGTAGQPIRSAEAGNVVYSGSGLIGYGRLIIIKHNDKYLSAYGHNRKLLVKEGDRVTKGERIAEMGVSNTGHAVLHFEIRRDGEPVDPLRLLPRK
jgi:lipoprotein NlpD